MLWVHPAITLVLWAIYLTAALATVFYLYKNHCKELVKKEKLTCLATAFCAIITMLAIVTTTPIPMGV